MPVSFRQYLLLRFRVEVGIVLIPWLAFVTLSDVIDLLFARTAFAETAQTAGSVLLLAGLFFFGPVMLAKIWKTSRLPDGPLRARLEEFCRAQGFRCRDLLLWHTHGCIGNAAVTGILPRLRYVILSDLLVEVCDEDQAAAILAHEVAHVKFQHLRFYIVFAVGFFLFYSCLEDLVSLAAPRLSGPHVGQSSVSFAEAASLLAFAGLYWGWLFGYISRRLELQADLFSAASAGGPAVFASALQKLATVAGMPLSADTWRHFSVDRRIEFLGIAGDPSVAARFLARVRRIRITFLIVFFAALAYFIITRQDVISF